METYYVYYEVGTEYFSSFRGRTLLQEAVSRRSERSTRYWYSLFWICGGKLAHGWGFFLVIRGFPVVIPAVTHTRLCPRAAVLLS